MCIRDSNKTVAGVGPVVCREAAWRAFDGEHLPANELTEEQKRKLMAAIDELKDCLLYTSKLPVILGIGFLLGFLITISEPDLQVLANQVPSIPNRTLILSVAAGVGLFLVFAFLRMLIGISLPKLRCV